MTKKIFRSILLASASVLLAVLVTVMGYFYGYYHSAREAQLKDGLRLAACGVEEGGRAYLEKLDEADRRYTRTPEYRLTWIAPGFIRLIRTEAARLVALVDDIIHLSQLDEGMALAEETVDLYELAVEAASVLRRGAEARSIRVEVTGGSACVTGGLGQRYRDRHPRGISVPGLRTLLPRGQEPVKGFRRDRAWAVDCQAYRPVSSRFDQPVQPDRRGDHDLRRVLSGCSARRAAHGI